MHIDLFIFIVVSTNERQAAYRPVLPVLHDQQGRVARDVVGGGAPPVICIHPGRGPQQHRCAGAAAAAAQITETTRRRQQPCCQWRCCMQHGPMIDHAHGRMLHSPTPLTQGTTTFIRVWTPPCDIAQPLNAPQCAPLHSMPHLLSCQPCTQLAVPCCRQSPATGRQWH